MFWRIGKNDRQAAGVRWLNTTQRTYLQVSLLRLEWWIGRGVRFWLLVTSTVRSVEQRWSTEPWESFRKGSSVCGFTLKFFHGKFLCRKREKRRKTENVRTASSELCSIMNQKSADAQNADSYFLVTKLRNQSAASFVQAVLLWVLLNQSMSTRKGSLTWENTERLKTLLNCAPCPDTCFSDYYVSTAYVSQRTIRRYFA